MKQYSADFRERLLSAIDAGLSQAEASRTLGVSTSTISRWRQQRDATGSAAPRPRPGRTPTIGMAHADALRAQVAANADATLAAHCQQWAREHDAVVSVATMCRAIRRLGITLKKRPDRDRTRPGPAGGLARSAGRV